MVVRRIEEATGRIRESLQDPLGEAHGRREPAFVERRLVQREQAIGEVRVVLEDAVAARPAVLPRPTERAVGAQQPADDRLGRAGRRRDVVRPRECPTRLREGRDGQPVPGRERLVVAGGLGPLESPSQQSAARAALSRSATSASANPYASARAASSRTRDRMVTPSQLPSSVTP